MHEKEDTGINHMVTLRTCTERRAIFMYIFLPSTFKITFKQVHKHVRITDTLIVYLLFILLFYTYSGVLYRFHKSKFTTLSESTNVYVRLCVYKEKIDVRFTPVHDH